MWKKFSIIVAIVIAILSVSVSSFASAYLANTKSGKFHVYNCRTIKNHDAWYFVEYESREEAIEDGFVPCKICDP